MSQRPAISRSPAGCHWRTGGAGLAACVLLAACTTSPETSPDGRDIAPSPVAADYGAVAETRHADLLTAGLGLEGLRGEPPLPADPENPSPAELRRLAIHANWRGLVDLTASGGFDADHPGLAPVPGREFHAFARLPERDQSFRVMVQLPDAFDDDSPCLLVAPSSGSRGIYGAHPVVAGFGLQRGCAIAYTDKGAGTDFYDHSSDTGVALDGRRVTAGSEPTGFEPAASGDAPLVSVPHAHGGDNPEADWGRHVLAAAAFGLEVLARQWPADRAFADDEVRVVAAGLSNGGGAVLRGLEADAAGVFDAAVAVAPNITPPGAPALMEYGTLAALYQPCLLADADALADMPFGNPALVAPGQARCDSLAEAGMLAEASPAAARDRLEGAGFDDHALGQAAVNTALGLWRTVTAMYASAYTGTGAFDMPCGYRVAVPGDDGGPRPATAAERNLWWATSSGMVPGAGLQLLDAAGAGDTDDPGFAGLACLRALWTDGNGALHAGADAIRASARLPDIPVVVVHGARDGLIPAAFSARPYVAAARDHGAPQLAYWEVADAQHFDVLVPLPGFAGAYRPLIPVGTQALEHLFRVLDGESGPGGDREIGGPDS